MRFRDALRRLLPLLLILAGIPAQGEGPLYVGGPPPHTPGLPFRWDPATFPLTYWTDLGTLGSQSKTQADQLVSDAFAVWSGVPTAAISFNKAGNLNGDITASNALAADDALHNCSTPLASGSIVRDRTIIYDTNGGVIDALLGPGQSDDTLGFADAVCYSADGNNHFTRGYAVLNGKFNNTAADLAELKAVMIHEFGHMLGLDHTQINLNCLGFCGSPDNQGLPTMFPILVDGAAMSTLAVDDIAGLSQLYPGTTFAPSTGTITGSVYFADGVTPALGFNVVARREGDPRATAVSNVSGFLFAGDAGNPLSQFPGFTPSPFGSRDQSLMGTYLIPGLPPGTYTVQLEGINNTGFYPFVGGSGLNPVGYYGFEFNLLAPCSLLFLGNSGSLATCNTSSRRMISVTAGNVENADIVLIGTTADLPRFDAYEDEP